MPPLREELSGLKGTDHLAQPGHYLCLPLILPWSKHQAHLKLKGKLLKKISSWKSNLLSQTDRVCLIRSVVSALPTYFKSSFLLPQLYCQELDSLMRHFWWGFPQEKRRNFVPRAWDSICWAKELSGLGESFVAVAWDIEEQTLYV